MVFDVALVCGFQTTAREHRPHKCNLILPRIALLEHARRVLHHINESPVKTATFNG